MSVYEIAISSAVGCIVGATGWLLRAKLSKIESDLSGMSISISRAVESLRIDLTQWVIKMQDRTAAIDLHMSDKHSIYMSSFAAKKDLDKVSDKLSHHVERSCSGGHDNS